MSKTLNGIENTNIEFTYKGRDYSVPVIDSLFLDDLSSEDIKNSLNEIPARMSYWKSLQVSLAREIAEVKEDFDFWFQKCYLDVDQEHPKRTESFKKTRVMLDNPEEFRTWKTKIRDLEDTVKKVDILVSGYNNRIWTLREIARLTLAEIGSLSAPSLGGNKTLANLTPFVEGQ